MAGPELVIVPAHPRAGDACRVEFEVRGDGRAVLPVFSSVAALVRVLGRCQPWVCVPLRVAREAADRAGQAELSLIRGSARPAGGGRRPACGPSAENNGAGCE